jgi:hypothetical protein
MKCQDGDGPAAGDALPSLQPKLALCERQAAEIRVAHFVSSFEHPHRDEEKSIEKKRAIPQRGTRRR